ncbi:MAG: hypothetical protein NTX53_15470 [candidate division WOR-3 bacterium]|nr:hypothetical protein [candidate division WOR-3 bacterium]
MAINAAKRPDAGDNPAEGDLDPLDLVVRSNTKSVEQHMKRVKVHDYIRDDREEAERVVREDMERSKRTSP